MIEIIKSKGLNFVFKRVIDKILKRIILYWAEFADLNKQTFTNKECNFQDFHPVYNSEMINYDLLDIEGIINLADNLILHKFNLLGSGLTEITYNGKYKGFENCKFDFSVDFKNLSELVNKSVNKKNQKHSISLLKFLRDDYQPIDWQRDFRSGYRWNSLIHFSKIKYSNIDGVDVKMPWELGRMYHLIVLFYAYKLSKNDKYIKEIESQIIDFMIFNPPKFGVQWSSPMDVALRAVNLVAVTSMIQTSEVKFSDQFLNIIINYLNDHLEFLMNHLEWSSGMRANHYFSNLCGIIYLSAFLPVSELTSFAFRFAVKELEKETLYQFNTEGSNFEGSLPYHNFVSEMLLQTYLLLSNLDKDRIDLLKSSFDITVQKKFNIHKDIIFRFNSDYELDFSNSRIQFNQEFKSRIISICKFTINTISPNLTDYNIGDNDDGFFFRFMPLINRNLSYNSTNRTELLKISKYIDKDSDNIVYKYYNQFGLFVKKSKSYDIAIRLGNLGQNGKGGHSHNDQLSFELYINNELIICDSGTYNYTASPKLRNHYRSTYSHNTLYLKNYEQNPIINNRQNLFWLSEKSKGKVIDYSDNHFNGMHSGFGIPHKRSFIFGKDVISIMDECQIDEQKNILIHIVPNIIIELSNDKKSLLLSSAKCKLRIKVDIGEINIVDYYYSPDYGVKYSSKLIVITTIANIINWEIEIL